ncbi:MAG TPA: DUF6084 family protein [Acidimicrobiales bacterium]|nr:DUF6084 family protein [Acidimicrobiales bacterium]
MAEVTFEVLGAEVERFAFTPTIALHLRVTEATGSPVGAIALRTQVRVEPQRRAYDGGDEERLLEPFGPKGQWAESLRPFLWAQLSTSIGCFQGSTEFDLPVACTYDTEVAATSYLAALRQGDIPLVLLFSGTVFSCGPRGLVAEPVPWHLEARYGLPVSCWRGAMDRFFPDSRWLRLSTEAADALGAFKAREALPTWDQAVALLLERAGELP